MRQPGAAGRNPLPRRGTSAVDRGLLSLLGVAFQSLGRFGTNLAIGRISGPSTLGVTASAAATAQVLALLWPATTSTAASKFIARARTSPGTHSVSAVTTHLRKRAAQSASVLAALAVPFWWLVGGGQLLEAVATGFLTFSFSLYTFGRGVQYGFDRIGRFTLLESGLVIISVGGAVAGATWLNLTGVFLLMPAAAGYLTIAITAWPRTNKQLTDPALRREIDNFIALGTLGTLTSAGMLQVSIILVRHVDGPSEAGQYAAALTLMSPISMLVTALTLTLLPRFASRAGQPGPRGSDADQATRLVVAMVVPILGTILILADPLVAIVWGSDFAGAIDAVYVLVFAVAATSLAAPSVTSLAADSQRQMTAATVAGLIGAALGLAFWAATVPRWGSQAVPYGYLVSASTIAAICVGMVWRRDDHKWFGLWSRVAAAVVVLLGLHVMQMQYELGQPVWLAVMIATYFGCVLLMLRPEIRMLMQTVKRNS